MSEASPSPLSQDFDTQKTDYFWKLGVHVKEVMQLHKDQGLWDRTPEGKRDWGNVSEHCLVEAARAREFGALLGFDQDLLEDLITAAALHDVGKRNEVILAKSKGNSWETYEKADDRVRHVLLDADFSPRVVRLAGAVGHGSLQETERVLAKSELTADDVAFLVMHYIDDYTVGSEWAEPGHEVDGKKVSNFDARMDNNEANEQYTNLNQEGRAIFDGRTTFETQRELGHAIESRLAEMIGNAAGEIVIPENLPVYIDDQIKHRITEPTVKAA